NPSLNAVVNGVMINNMSGIAPGAWLGNYNVFPGGVLNARSQDILRAVAAAVSDVMDGLDLSVGGGCHVTRNGMTVPCAKIDALVAGLNNVSAAGVVVAVAAGNSGPGAGTIESPGRAAGVITAGASTNQHFVGEPFTYPSAGGTTVGAAVGAFEPLPAGSFSLFDTQGNGCDSVDPGASGTVAIIDRGACTFSQKV